MVTFLLGTTVFIHFTRTPSLTTAPLIALYLLSGLSYLITLLSALALRWLNRFIAFAFVQIVWEVIFVSSLIYITGGIHSIFSFLYLLAIIIGGTLQYRRGAFLAATAGTLLYGLVIAGLEKGLLPYLIHVDKIGNWSEVMYNLSINLAAMFGTAVLASYLTEKLRTTGNELVETRRRRDTLLALNDNIVRSLSSGVVTLDLDGRITSLNRAASELTGIKEAEARGREFSRLFPELDQALKTPPEPMRGPANRFEINWTDPGGRTLNLEFRSAPLLGGEGELLGALVIFNDVTELRKMEDRLRKSDRLAAVGQLAAGMAHEIRNPLASISGSIQVLERELNLDDTAGKLMRIVLRETGRLDALITDFLLFARPAPRNLERFNLEKLLRELAEIYRHRPEVKDKIELVLELENGLDMKTDPQLLRQILYNLLNNAVQAMPDRGRLTIRAAMLKSSERRKTIEIQVEDTGPGVPDEIKDRIFDPFFTTRGGGTGLGLSVVYRIVEAMEGAVNIENGKNGGARFVISIPAWPLEEQKPEPDRTEGPAAEMKAERGVSGEQDPGG